MAETQSQTHPLLRLEAWAIVAGVASGLVAGVTMGVLLQFGTGLITELGAFVGERSVVAGWLVHLFISAVYGAVFAVVVAYPAVRDFFDTFGRSEYVLVGVTYATMIAAVSIGILPFVFDVPWAPGSQATQQGAIGTGLGGLLPSLVFAVSHLVYGAILGAVYASVGATSE